MTDKIQTMTPRYVISLSVLGALSCVAIVAGCGGASGAGDASCDIAQTRLSVGPPWSEATGQHTASIVLTNRGRRPCALDGYPTIAFLDGRGRELPFVYSHKGDQMITGRKPTDVRVRAGGSSFFAFNKYRCDIHHLAIARRLRIRLPGGRPTRSLQLPRDYPLIDYCGGGGPWAVVTVSPIVRRLDDLQASR